MVLEKIVFLHSHSVSVTTTELWVFAIVSRRKQPGNYFRNVNSNAISIGCLKCRILAKSPHLNKVWVLCLRHFGDMTQAPVDVRDNPTPFFRDKDTWFFLEFQEILLNNFQQYLFNYLNIENQGVCVSFAWLSRRSFCIIWKLL